MKLLRLGTRTQPRTLPLRLWLVLAVVAITGAGFLAQVSMTIVVSVWEQKHAADQLASIRQVIGTDAAHWQNPMWQQHANTSLAALGIDVALVPTQSTSSGQVAQPDQIVYETPGARQYLAAGGSGTVGASPDQVPGEGPSYLSGQVVFQRIVITNPEHSPSQAPVGVAFLWYSQPGIGKDLGLAWVVVELGTFMLTLAIVVWIIGQPVLRPLAAMSRAAEGVAGGDLEVHLPPSPVREIAAVNAALEGMSGALRESLDRQAALEEERRLFVGAVAHDLRTPLFILRGHLKGLERGVAATPEKIAHYVAVCQAKADALERLIADLFAFTRLEYLEQEPERAPLELGELLRQTAEDAQPLAAAKGIVLVLDEPRAPCSVLGDSHLLSRAVENLLDNALRHTPDGGQIGIRWQQREDQVIFAVEDTGIGIPAHDFPRLFTPLFRGEASRNRQTGGAGLGLATARRILRAHGGDLTAANSVDGGAVFTGTLPASRSPASLSTNALITTHA